MIIKRRSASMICSAALLSIVAMTAVPGTSIVTRTAAATAQSNVKQSSPADPTQSTAVPITLDDGTQVPTDPVVADVTIPAWAYGLARATLGTVSRSDPPAKLQDLTAMARHLYARTLAPWASPYADGTRPQSLISCNMTSDCFRNTSAAARVNQDVSSASTSIGSASSPYATSPQDSHMLEGANFNDRNDCGPAAARVASSSWVSGPYATLGWYANQLGTDFDTTHGTHLNSGLINPLNSQIHTSWYWTNGRATSEYTYRDRIGYDLYDNTHPLISSVNVCASGGCLPGWSSNIPHILSIYGYRFNDGGGSGSQSTLTYLETANPASGGGNAQNSPGSHTVSEYNFWQDMVQNADSDVW